MRVCCCKVFGGNEDEFLVWGTMWIVLPIIGDVLTTCTWWGIMSETNGSVGGEELDSDDVLLYRALSLLSSASLVTMLASLSVSKSPFILVAATAGKRRDVNKTTTGIHNKWIIVRWVTRRTDRNNTSSLWSVCILIYTRVILQQTYYFPLIMHQLKFRSLVFSNIINNHIII